MGLIIELIKYNGHIPITSTLQFVVYCFSQIVSLLFTILYLHQMFYILIGSLHHTKIKGKEFKLHSLGIVISARNESKVIGNLIKSIQANDYPQELLKIFVVADNCTDNTAQICRDMGCVVFERFNEEKKGKGFALNYLFTKLHTEEEYASLIPEAYIVVDADNILKPNFITEINKVYASGYDMVTSYRNSKNFGKNWITAGYGYWFLHEARHLNNSRMMLHTSCAISGTGFLITTEVVKEFNNWEFFTLTEDIQCSTVYALTKRKVGYCSTAELYDEQPETFRQSWRQRERWAKGFYQVLGKYGFKLFGNMFTNFSCWDILTTIFPALFITLLVLIGVPICMVVALCLGDMSSFLYALQEFANYFVALYEIMFIIGALICITEWKRIKIAWYKKIFYVFTLPFFMVTYVPIAVSAMFKKVEWKPIVHTANTTLDEIEKDVKNNGKTNKENQANKKENKTEIKTNENLQINENGKNKTLSGATKIEHENDEL